MRFANDVFSRITISEAHGRAASLMVKGIRASLRFGTGPWVASVGKHIREVIDHVTGNVAETITVATEYDAYYYQVKRV